jgi:Na+/proline symporter
MFTEDVFTFYGGRARFGEGVQVHTGRIFVIVLTVVAYIVAMRASVSIFELAVQYAFSGYAALLPLLIGALLWKGSTKWGALASVLWVAASVLGIAVLQARVPPPIPGMETPLWSILGYTVLARTAGGTSVLGYLPVVPMTLISGLLMMVVSWLTPKPSQATLGRYFVPQSRTAREADQPVMVPRAG